MFLKCSKSQFFKIKIYLHNREYQQKSFKLRGPTIQIVCDQVIVVNVLYKYLQGDTMSILCIKVSALTACCSCCSLQPVVSTMDGV